MKKHLLGIAALLMLFVASSCTNETRESVTDGDGAVAFRAALGKQTKASEFTVADWSTGDKLTVQSYVGSTTTLFNTFTLEYTEGTPGSWTYTPVKYQPGYPLRYYSVDPTANVSNETVSTTSYSFDYTILGVATQEDLIGAYTAAIQDEEVILNFNHLLSQVNFAVQGIPGVKIEISNISVNDVLNSGTYTFGQSTPWALEATDADYVYDLTAAKAVASLETLAEGTSNEIQYLGNGGADNYANANALMLMPQTFDETTTGNFSFTFSLTVDTNGDGDFDDETANPANTNISKTVDLDIFETTAWAPGKRYAYVIDFTSYLAGGPISFKVIVNDWENDDDNTLVETLHVPNANVNSIEAAIDHHSHANAAKTALSVFPISVAVDPTAALVITNIVGFEGGDMINVEFPSETGAAFLKCAAPGWAAAAPAGRVVTLTCTTPNAAADYAEAAEVVPTGSTGTTVLLTDLMEAIDAQGAANTATTDLKIFPVNVSDAFDAATAITTITGFDSGDTILIICPDVTEAAKVSSSASGWTLTTVGNVVVLKMD